MLCHEALKVNQDHTGGQIYLLRCKRWSCELCQPENAARVKRMAKDGTPDKFLTLTWKATDEFTPDQAAIAMRDAWAKMVRMIRKQYPGRTFEYFRVFERTKKGWPHLHILMRAPFINQKWYSETWALLTGAFIVDIRAVKNIGHAVWYIAKYIGKELHKFAGVTRFYRSRNYCQPKSDADKPLRFGRYWSDLFLIPHLYLHNHHLGLQGRGANIVRYEAGKSLVWEWPQKYQKY